ncbi:MAG: tRNA (adenosine(37)-N6)-threonylcarbamoyltransferase complex ATPase subunit type 1 TsaE [Pseudomonadota bacterium]
MKNSRPSEIVTCSPGETRRVGRGIGRMMAGGGVVGLTGDLGAGKTVIASGIFRGAGLPEGVAVTSPSFTIINMYPGRRPMYHVDLYRLSSAVEALEAGVAELWEGGDGSLVVVEWFEKFPEIRPPGYMAVTMDIVGQNERKLKFYYEGE